MPVMRSCTLARHSRGLTRSAGPIIPCGVIACRMFLGCRCCLQAGAQGRERVTPRLHIAQHFAASRARADMIVQSHQLPRLKPPLTVGCQQFC